MKSILINKLYIINKWYKSIIHCCVFKTKDFEILLIIVSYSDGNSPLNLEWRRMRSGRARTGGWDGGRRGQLGGSQILVGNRFHPQHTLIRMEYHRGGWSWWFPESPRHRRGLNHIRIRRSECHSRSLYPGCIRRRRWDRRGRHGELGPLRPNYLYWERCIGCRGGRRPGPTGRRRRSEK